MNFKGQFTGTSTIHLQKTFPFLRPAHLYGFMGLLIVDHVRNKEVLLRVKEQRNILHEIIKRKANWISHILRRNCLVQRVIAGKIKGGI